MIEVKNLTKIYKSKKKNNCVALNKISFSLPDKGLVFIIGKSGSGKSTLLNMLGGLDSVSSGKIHVFGNNIHKFSESKLYSYRSNMVGFIFQDFHLLDDLTVEENIIVSLKLERIEIKDQVNKVLKQVDLEGYNNRYPNELSGGQKQRVAIARALIKNPNIILADEPTGNLDSNTTKQIIKLIKKISKDKLVIIVSHNLYDAYDYADRIIELSDGRILNDLEINNEYSNDIKVEHNKLVLPLLKKFDKEELSSILNKCKDDSITEIVQDDKKFTKTKVKYNEHKIIEIKNKNLSLKETLRFSCLLGKKRITRFLFSSIMLAMLVVVLALGQSIAYFNSGDIIIQELNSKNTDFIIKKNIDTSIGNTKTKIITNEDIAKFEEIENIKVYKLYNDSLRASGFSGVCVLNPAQANINDIYIKETFGTLETTKEYAQKLLKLDELDIYSGSIQYKPSGVYITDFIADSLIVSGLHGESYDELLGYSYESKIWWWGYINGIIKTDYKIKYKDVIEKIQKQYHVEEYTEDLIEFMDYISQALAISYTFEEDYISTFDAYDSNKNFKYTYKLEINGVDVSKSVPYVGPGSVHKYKINKGEIYMNYKIYNSIFNTNYSLENVNTFVPHEIEFQAKGFYDEVEFNRTLKIAKIGAFNSPTIMMDEETHNDYKKEFTSCIGLYIDGDNIKEAINIAIDNDYVANSIRMSAVQTMTKAVSVFNSFFELLVGILICSCIFTIVSFGIKNIKSNMYEIGVLKALGCRNSRFIIMFVIHTLVINLLLLIISTSGFYIFSGVANNVLTESLKQLASNHVVLNLNFIEFDFELIIKDNLLIGLISIISTIIPLSILRKIKPITIIKAKE